MAAGGLCSTLCVDLRTAQHWVRCSGMTSKHRGCRQSVGRVPRSLRDATLRGVQRATIRTGVALLVGGVSGVAWGHLPQTFPMHEVGPLP
jgi:hypothetical protein